MAEQIKRGLTIHPPHIVDDTGLIWTKIIPEIESQCSDMTFESDEVATAEVRGMLESGLDCMKVQNLEREPAHKMIDNFRWREVRDYANNIIAWLAIDRKGIDNFDATVGGREPE